MSIFKSKTEHKKEKLDFMTRAFIMPKDDVYSYLVEQNYTTVGSDKKKTNCLLFI